MANNIGRVEVTVKPDTREFRETVRDDLAKMRDFRVNVEAQLDSAKAQMQARAFAQRVSAMDATVKVKADVDKSLKDVESKFSKLSKGFLKNALKWGPVGAAGLGAVGGAAAAAIPAVTTLGVALGTVALGMDGIKAAAKPLQPQFDALKKSVADTFQQNLTAPFAKLGPLLTQLQQPLQGMATSISGVLSGIIDMVTSAAGMQNLTKALEGANQFIAAMGPGIAKFTSDLLSVAAQAAPAMADLGKAFSSILTAISGALVDSPIQAAIQSLTATLGGLAEAVEPIIRTIVQMAAAIGPSLGIVFSQLGAGISAMAPGLVAFTQAVGGIAVALAPLLPLVGQMASALGSMLASALTALMPGLTSFVSALVTGMQPVITAITPILTQLGTILGTVLNQALDAVAPLFVVLGGALGQMLTAVQPIVPILGQLASAVMPVLQAVVAAIAPVITILAQTFVQILGAVTPLLPIISQLATQIGGLLASAVTQMAPLIAQLAMAIGELLVSAVQAILPVLPAMVSVISAVIAVAAALLPIIIKVASVIIGTLIAAFRAVIPVVTGVISVFASLVSAVVSSVASVISTVGRLPSTIKGYFSGAGSWLVASGRALIDGFKNGIMAAFGAVKSAVSSGLAAVRSLFPFSPAKEGPFSGRGYTTYSGKALMTDFGKGIKSGAKSAIDSVSDVMSRISDATQVAPIGIGFDVADPMSSMSGSVLQGSMNMTQGAELTGMANEIAEGFAKVKIEMDGRQVAKGVNKTNTLNGRRR